MITFALRLVAIIAIVGCSGGRHQEGESAVLVGAGDIAGCGSASDTETASLLDHIGGTVFTLGDNAYPDGTAQQFEECYGETWGRHFARTRPAIGNHEYATPEASGYFGYFGELAGTTGEGWYSYDAGAWHVVVLNSECDLNGGACNPDSGQFAWLADDIAQHKSRCLLAYWHSPRFSSGEHGDQAQVQPLWEAVIGAGADIVLSASDHDYERFTLLDANGVPDPTGTRLFVVGTGGGVLRPIAQRREHSDFSRDDVHGVLRLALRRSDYAWAFVAAPDGAVLDQGVGACH